MWIAHDFGITNLEDSLHFHVSQTSRVENKFLHEKNLDVKDHADLVEDIVEGVVRVSLERNGL